MSRRIALMLAVISVCMWAIICAGCRQDLIDATPVDEGAPMALDAPGGDAAAVEGEVSPDGAEGGVAGGAAETEGFRADQPVPPSADSAPAQPTARRRGGASGAEGGSAPAQPGGGGATPEQLRERPARRPEATGDAGQRPAPGAGAGGGALFERADANGDGLLQRSELPEAMRDRMMEADANGDGALSQEELRAAMPRRPEGEQVTPEERRRRMMERMDTNGDGKITLDEMPERMRERMRAVDTNGDGVLSAEELQSAGGAWGQRRPGGGTEGRRGGGGTQGNN